jgi:hypothetical protein
MVRLFLVLAAVGALILSADAPVFAQGGQACTQGSDQAATTSNARGCPSGAALNAGGGNGCTQRSERAAEVSNARYCASVIVQAPA